MKAYRKDDRRRRRMRPVDARALAQQHREDQNFVEESFYEQQTYERDLMHDIMEMIHFEEDPRR
jgi:hypothetical protein